jgi:hypothetical protein
MPEAQQLGGTKTSIRAGHHALSIHDATPVRGCDRKPDPLATHQQSKSPYPPELWYVTWRTKAILREASLVTFPAYHGALVTGARAQVRELQRLDPPDVERLRQILGAAALDRDGSG